MTISNWKKFEWKELETLGTPCTAQYKEMLSALRYIETEQILSLEDEYCVLTSSTFTS